MDASLLVEDVRRCRIGVFGGFFVVLASSVGRGVEAVRRRLPLAADLFKVEGVVELAVAVPGSGAVLGLEFVVVDRDIVSFQRLVLATFAGRRVFVLIRVLGIGVAVTWLLFTLGDNFLCVRFLLLLLLRVGVFLIFLGVYRLQGRQLL